MRASLGLAPLMLALGTLGAALSATPAAAFDDTLPRWAPARGYHAHPHCHRLFWRERCRPYRLGGYFVRNPDFRRMPVFRRR